MPRSTDKNFFKNKIKSFLSLFNYEIKRINNFEQRFFDSVVEITEDEKKILESIGKFALSSKSNQWSIIQSLKRNLMDLHKKGLVFLFHILMQHGKPVNQLLDGLHFDL